MTRTNHAVSVLSVEEKLIKRGFFTYSAEIHAKWLSDGSLIAEIHTPERSGIIQFHFARVHKYIYICIFFGSNGGWHTTYG